MKKMFLMTSTIFLIMSSFSSAPKEIFNCEQQCSESATLVAHYLGEGFDVEVELYFACAELYCNQQ